MDTKRLFGPENGDESAVLIIVFHPSSVLVTIGAKKKIPENPYGRFTPIRGSFCRILVTLAGIMGEKKNRLVIIMAGMVPHLPIEVQIVRGSER